MARSQRAWIRSAIGWTPGRGIHRGIKCDVCGVVPDDIYFIGSGPTYEDAMHYCKSHLPEEVT